MQDSGYWCLRGGAQLSNYRRTSRGVAGVKTRGTWVSLGVQSEIDYIKQDLSEPPIDAVMADEKSKGKQPIIHEQKEHEGDSSRGSRGSSPPKDQQQPARNAEEAKQRLREMQNRNSESEETDERTIDEEQKLERRLSKLESVLRARRRSSRITNVSFEFGRPKLEPTEDMRQDSSNVYNRPTTDVLYRIPPRAVSNNMANSEEMSNIKVALEGMGVPTEHIANVILQAVIYCKDVSSSVYMDPQGTFEFPGGAIMADSVLGIMKEKAGSLRRVCRLYAPVTWNYMLVHNAPPADWAADGFQESTKFAAFDCFDYVENKAAIQPLDHIIRRPTPAEKVAHATHKRIALDKSNRNETYANLGTEITGGRLGPEIVRNFNNANNK